MTYPFLKQLLYPSRPYVFFDFFFAFVHIICPNLQDTVYQRFYGIKFPAYEFPEFRISADPPDTVRWPSNTVYRLPYTVGNPPDTVRRLPNTA
jgi:hypothetical protein